MMPSRHATISFGLGLILWWATSSFFSLLLSMIAGFFIDMDHLVEYFRYRLYGREDKMFIVFHSIELLLPLWMLAIAFSWQTEAVVLTLAFFAHLISDAYGNGANLKVYLLTCRLLKRFDYKTLMDGQDPDFEWARRGLRSWW